MTQPPESGPDVVLVHMPWASARAPSLSLSILQSHLEAADIATRCLYPTLWFADAIGAERYERYGYHDSVFSQYVFSKVLFGPFQPDGPSFAEYMEARGVSRAQLDQLARVEKLAGELMEWCVDAVDWRQVRMVGFTTTFMQTMPSLALARVLGGRFPHLAIVFGGAGCQGEMGHAIHRNFEFVHGTCVGEGEDLIVPLYQAIARGQTPRLDGLLWRDSDGTIAPHTPARLVDMSGYRSPEYRDYFAQKGAFPALSRARIEVPFEASRGCWWGAIKHCRFCGLNGETMAQRARPVAEVVDELVRVRREYGVSFFAAADNILAREHLDTLAPLLRERLPGASLFFEVRVTMRRRQLEALSQAGVRYVQPGIESLIPEVLALVDKGTSPLANLVFLRRAREFGVHVEWNMMCGLPGEQGSWYQDMIARMPRFFHLQAPDVVRFGLQRFSPYFERPQEHGIVSEGPLPGLEYVWNLPRAEIAALSFEWAFTAPESTPVEEFIEPLKAQVDAWRRGSWTLSAEMSSSGRVVVEDTRPDAEDRVCVLSCERSSLVRALESPSNPRTIARRLERAGGPAANAETTRARLQQDLDWLEERGFVYRERGQYAALIVPREPRDFWLEAPVPLSMVHGRAR